MIRLALSWEYCQGAKRKHASVIELYLQRASLPIGYEFVILMDDDGVFISNPDNRTLWADGNRIPSNPFQ